MKIKITSIIYLFISKAASPLCSFFVFAYVARILTPEDFGVVALAMSIVTFFSIAFPSGWRTYLLKNKQISDNSVGVCLCLHIFCSVIFFIIISAFTLFFSFSFQSEEFNKILFVLSIKLPFDAFFHVANAIILRNLKYNVIASRLILASLLASVATLIFIINGFGIWSLIFSQVAFSIFNAVFSVFHSWEELNFKFSFSDFKKTCEFCAPLTLTDFITSSSQNFESVIIGIMLGKKELGFFNVANRLRGIINDILINSINEINISTSSKIINNELKLREAFLKSIRMTELLLFPFLGFCIVFSEPIIILVVGDQWLPASFTFKMLCCLLIIISLGVPQKNIIILKGQSSWWLKWQLWISCFVFPGAYFFSKTGLENLLLFMIVYKFIFCFLSAYKSCKILSCNFRKYLVDIAKSLLTLFVCSIITWALKKELIFFDHVFFDVFLWGFLYFFVFFLLTWVSNKPLFFHLNKLFIRSKSEADLLSRRYS